MTFREAVEHITNKLASIYDKTEASNISEWVVEHITGTRKTDRISQKEKQLSIEEQGKLQDCLQRLLEHEPVQYVLNEAWFCGFRFYVDKNVLIPRPETEELVEWIISNCKFPINELNILDVGTGSGCIAIALKRKIRKSEVTGCDVSQPALDLARRNADALGVNVDFVQLDFLDPGQRDRLGNFDIVVSNPPYIPGRDRSRLRPNVSRFEPPGALFVPDNNPLLFYEALASFGKTHLKEKGSIYAELNEDLGKGVAELFRSHRYDVELKKDLQQKDRMIRGWVRGS